MTSTSTLHRPVAPLAAPVFSTPILDAIASRSVGGGVEVCLYLPRPDRVRITVTAENGKIVMDTFEVERARGLDAYRHTSLYSEPLAEALR